MVRQTPARSTRSSASRDRRPKNEESGEDQPPAIYREMLEEAEARDPAQFHSDRPIKRRRVGDTKAIPVKTSAEYQTASLEQPETGVDNVQEVQTVYDSATEDESDVEWEDVDMQPSVLGTPVNNTNTVLQGRDETLQITLDKEPEARKKTASRFKPLTGAERQLRLDIHKVHLLCLLAHVNVRNLWCNDDETQGFLKKMITKRVMALLHPNEDKPSYTRSTSFMDGVNQLADIFQRRFQITKPGLSRAHWESDQTRLKQRTESIMSNAEVFLSKKDYRSQAKTMQGSRDFGAQLFCTLLRSAAIEARLVCSLQPLPFSGTVKDMTPSKPKSKYIIVSSDDHDTSTNEPSTPATSPTPPRPRRIGRPEFRPAPAKPAVRSSPQPLPEESSYPVFWVEVFNEAVQKWFAVDPIVTKSLAKHSKFEPPASDVYNHMNYVVAFEDDASVRDVTKRYTKAYNAKTRKTRVESTKGGEAWWTRAMMAYEKPFLEDRDEAEVSELTSKTASEPMPRNIMDFKDHPVYALRRHLHRNEAIHPDRIIGHVSLSKASSKSSKSDNLEPVYRRSDVHTVRSALRWYRFGRDIKVGEQPLKRVAATRPKRGFTSDDEDAEPEQTALYAEFQTEIYVPPPVVNGRIPKNAFGNLDVYVPSMVPSGAVHVKRPEASRAARILGIDSAQAVTGFDFKGRQGTAVFEGIVIAAEYQEALEEVLTSMEEEKREAAIEARSEKAISLWRLFLLKLRIAERVKEYASEDEAADDSPERELSIGADEGGGGFFPEPDQPTLSPPRKSLIEPLAAAGAAALEGEAGGFENDASGQTADDFGGGFIVDEPVAEEQTLEPTVPQPSPTVSKSMLMKNPSEPKYELVVVPNTRAASAAPPTIHEESGFGAQEGSSRQVPTAGDSSAHNDSKSASMESISKPASPAPVPHRSPTPEDLDSEIEKGSLLSEDPEDEDAIPEWLI